MTKINNLVNTIHQGDCLEVLDSLEKGSVDLAYLDPHFFTEKRHSLKTRDRTKEFCFDDIWGSEAIYRQFLFECICKVKAVLKKTRLYLFIVIATLTILYGLFSMKFLVKIILYQK